MTLKELFEKYKDTPKSYSFINGLNFLKKRGYFSDIAAEHDEIFILLRNANQISEFEVRHLLSLGFEYEDYETIKYIL